MNYLIKVWGRSGSLYIVQWLAKNQGCIPVHSHDNKFYSKLDTEHDIAIHDHYEFIPKQPAKFVLVLSLRKNKFDQILSWIISERVDAWNTYQNVTKTKNILIEKEELLYHYNRLMLREKSYKNILHYNWNDVHTVYYEDIFKDNYLKNTFNYNKNISIDGVKDNVEKSPIDKTKFISNYKELKNYFYQINQG